MGSLDIDFAALLVGLSLFTGVVWAIDHFAFRKRRLARDPQAKEPTLVEYSRSFFPVIFAVLIIRSFLAEPFRIPSSSMMPTLLIGDFILVNKFAYGLRWPVIDHKFIDIGAPERGDVVVFRNPAPGVHHGEDYIKRVVGLPGDEIAYRDHTLYINGEAVALEPLGRYVGIGPGAGHTGDFLLRERLPGATHEVLHGRGMGRDTGPVRVPDGHYFVLGDNRDNSEDSRVWGLVRERDLVGKAFLIWLNLGGDPQWSRIGTVIE